MNGVVSPVAESLTLSRSTEIRKLPVSIRMRLSYLLDIGNSWKTLMGHIPSSQSDGNRLYKYSSEDIRLIEDASLKQKRPGFDILIDEWGTSGKCRPTLNDFIALLLQIGHYQAADYLTIDVLKGSPNARPEYGSAAVVTPADIEMQPVSPSQFEWDTNTMTWTTNSIREATNPLVQERGAAHTSRDSCENAPINFDTHLPHISYNELEIISNGFDSELLVDGGRKLGSGAFGSVFLGINLLNSERLIPQLPDEVAIKRLHTHKIELDVDLPRLFKTEVETMSKYCHENLLPLLAYSANGPDCCLLYGYMPNGSLESALACDNGKEPLSWQRRITVGQGVARALVHLHTSGEKPLVHRDVKSANVLLDEHFNPKLGDFGLIRTGASGKSKSFAMTSNVLGTSAYMAPEAFRGDVSVKLDTFSFGVILLELLTGLPPYSEDREGNDLISHVDAVCDEKDFLTMLDPRLERLDEDTARSLHSLAFNCVDEKKKRPLMTRVLEQLLCLPTRL